MLTPVTLPCYLTINQSENCAKADHIPWGSPPSLGLQNCFAEGFPGGTVVKNLPANAGDTGSSPAPGRSHIPAGQLSPCDTTTEPAF